MRYIKYVLALAVVYLVIGCGSYHKLLKSEDFEKQYTEALRCFYAKNYNKSAALFNKVISNLNGTTREDTIIFYFAKSLYYVNDLEQAAELMNSFRYKYARSPFTEESEYIYALCHYRQSGSYERDQSTSVKAIQAFTEYLNRHPESIKTEDIYVMVDELTRKLYQKRFNNASLYYKLGKYNAAITALKSTLKQYPEIPFKEEIMYLICKSWFDYAEKSVESRQLDRYLKMIDSYYSYRSEFPDNEKRLAELQVMLDVSKQFTDEHGYQARLIEKNRVNIDERKERIAQKKDSRFEALNKADRQKLTEEIKFEQEQIKKDRQIIKENKKEIKIQAGQKAAKEKEAAANSEESDQNSTKTTKNTAENGE